MKIDAYARVVNWTELALVEEQLRELGFVVNEPGPEWGSPSPFDLVAHPDGMPEVVVGVTQGEVAHLPPWASQTTLEPAAVIVAHRRITPRQAEQLRRAGQGYVDASGNAWIEAPGLRIRVEGRPVDPRTRGLPGPEAGWAMRPTGLQVLFALLTIPDLLEARLVDIASAAGVSTATAHHVMRDLGARRWIDTGGPARVWLDRDAAGRAWLHAYVSRIAPAVEERGYAVEGALDPAQLMRSVRDAERPGWLTGGAALGALGHGLHPAEVTVYAPLPYTAPPGVRIARPRGGAPATLKVRPPWWPPSAYPAGVAPLLLACADALASGEPRAAELAREVMSSDPDLRPLLTA